VEALINVFISGVRSQDSWYIATWVLEEYSRYAGTLEGIRWEPLLQMEQYLFLISENNLNNKISYDVMLSITH